MSDDKTNRKLEYNHTYDPKKPLDSFAIDLEQKLGDTLGQRSLIDKRMVEDLLNYQGRYDSGTMSALTDAKRSKVFINITRSKTDAAEAQMVDLLFPSADKNWGIAPTPVPELEQKMQDSQPYQDSRGTQFQDAKTGETITNGDIARREREQAEEAALHMEREIDDQLKESRYEEKCREVLHDGCVLGTGILKGPVISGVSHREFKQVELKDPETGEVIDEVFKAVMAISYQPGVEVVRPWDFYPDMSGAKVSEAEFIFERRYMTRKQVRNLVLSHKFNADQVRKVLAMKPGETQHTSGTTDDIRNLAGINDELNDTRYEVWEYHGPIPTEVLLEQKLISAKEAENPLNETTGIVIYCGGVVLSVRLHIMDYEEDFPYQVWNWVADDTCMFGFGVPRLMRDAQATMNTAMRQTLDNSGVTAGPQLVINRTRISPVDGSWDIKPFKLWEMRQSGSVQDAIQKIEFGNHQNELVNIYRLAREITDEVTGIPMLTQGEQGQSTPVLGGMSMLMNAANTVRRNQVKAWDDRVTTPLIKSFYAYNMEHSDKEEIKGDYQVVARGVSALLQREHLSNNIMNLINFAGTNQMFAEIIAPKSRKLMEEWMRANQLPTDWLPTKEEQRQYQEQIAERQQQQQDPAVVSAQAQLQTEQLRMQQLQMKIEAENQRMTAQMQSDQQQASQEYQLKLQEIAAQIYKVDQNARTELMKLANNRQINSDKLVTEMNKLQAKLSAEHDKFLAEIKMKQQFGPEGNFGLEQ